jgi:alanine-synthesizing transaminase
MDSSRDRGGFRRLRNVEDFYPRACEPMRALLGSEFISDPGQRMQTQAVTVGSRLDRVRYDIRGPLNRRAHEREAEGHSILRLNIGNPCLFEFRVPEHLRDAIAKALPKSEAYCLQQGRPKRARRSQRRHGAAAAAANVFIGNGVSELIDLSLRALLDAGDEVLIPAPDYPLWTAATRLNGGEPVHYDCPAERAHLPDPDEITALITPRTKALVVINPNNPTGAVYPRALLEALAAVAGRHGLVLLSDEIYDRMLYDGLDDALARIERQLARTAQRVGASRRVAQIRSRRADPAPAWVARLL